MVRDADHSFNRASFTGADVQDAKRGRPASGLRAYAAQRGLGFYDRVTMAGYRSAMPAVPQDQFNVMLGTLPGGEHGVPLHAALGVPVFNGTLAWSGPFHGVRLRAGRFKLGRAVLEAIPVMGHLVSQPRAGAFAAARAPTTVAAVRMPETVGVQARLRIDQRGKAPPFDFGNRVSLNDVGLAGWSAQSEPAADLEFLREVVAGPVGGALRRHDGDALFQVLVWWGTLVVRRNGYLETLLSWTSSVRPPVRSPPTCAGSASPGIGHGVACVWCLPSYWGGDALMNDLDAFLRTAADVLGKRF